MKLIFFILTYYIHKFYLFPFINWLHRINFGFRFLNATISSLRLPRSPRESRPTVWIYLGDYLHIMKIRYERTVCTSVHVFIIHTYTRTRRPNYTRGIEYPRAVKSWAIVPSNKDRPSGEEAHLYDRKTIGGLMSNNKNRLPRRTVVVPGGGARGERERERDTLEIIFLIPLVRCPR